jgi:hypothetical protein
MSDKNLQWSLTSGPALFTIGNTFTDTTAATERGWERVRAVTGTASSSGTTVTGTSTLFTTELNVGSVIVVGAQVRTVTAIASDTSLTTDIAFSPALSGSTITKSMEVIVALGQLRTKDSDALVVPTFTLAVPANGNKVTGTVLTFTVTPSEPVEVVGLPTIAVTIGSNVRLAVYDAVNSTSTSLLFKYTVVAGDVDADGIVVANVITLGTTDEVGDLIIGGGDVNIAPAALTFTVPTTTGITVN